MERNYVRHDSVFRFSPSSFLILYLFLIGIVGLCATLLPFGRFVSLFPSFFPFSSFRIIITFVPVSVCEYGYVYTTNSNVLR